MAVAGDADFGQIDHGAVAAVGVIMLGKIQRAVAHLLPEAGGGNVLGAVVDVIAKVDGNRNLRLQQAVILLGADLRRSARFDGDDRGDIFHRYVPTDRAAL